VPCLNPPSMLPLLLWGALLATVPPADAQVPWVRTREIPSEDAFQAAAATETHVYAINNRRIAKHDRETGEQVAVSTGEAEHLNSGFFWDGKLYCAHSNFPKRPESSDIRVLDPETMELTVWKDFGESDGSLTWAIRHDDQWWCMFAFYGDENAKGYLARFDDQWQETGRWLFPSEVIEKLGSMSVSGGLWWEDGFLVTSHHERELHKVKLPEDGSTLVYVETVPAPFWGQGIAHDPVTGGLIGIDRPARKLLLAQPHTSEAESDENEAEDPEEAVQQNNLDSEQAIDSNCGEPDEAETLQRASIPLDGNSFVTQGDTGRGRRGRAAWDQPETVISIFFRVDRPADLRLALEASVSRGESSLQASVPGADRDPWVVTLQAAEPTIVPLGTLAVTEPGYVRIDLQGIERTGPRFAEITNLEVISSTPDLTLTYVRDNQSNRFYWGRRGPSVHLRYNVPRNRQFEWFYSELTVPDDGAAPGYDPIGSFFMANGFGEGYFGMQVNSPTERRILFSVWSPFRTDNPREIPEDQRIVLLAKGKDVHAGEFGNEGSGGQSYLRYPWKAGTTYRFLNRATPDGRGNTIYSAWFFAPEENDWQLIASFLRPATDKHLIGLHSFLENFSDRNGWLTRKAHYGNQWARDTGGTWHRLTGAQFTGDDIARRGYRLDYAGGIVDNAFFLQNGGFFAATVPLDSRFTREEGPASEPEIPIGELEGVSAGLD
jgi:hypothetical protein